ncbi:deSI-like protein At4g17486 [Rutidosis leptorrhynchoides]|uniref:deSI-like protein At4g17486 n=1 Tax=Rutidosis leptorrhynchoides TaxID=125765 RepID=UPI003A995033
MLCRRKSSTRCRKGGSVPVYLNVYDLTSVNGCAYWFGLGVYHSGIQVHGVEYAYGFHKNATTGIFEGEPKECEGFTFRKQIMIGWTRMNLREVRMFMKELAENYKGTSYNLITKNCNHFCNDACLRLTGNPIPSWINRLARIGLLCNCIIPTNISSCKIGIEDSQTCNEEENLKGCSSRFSSSSSSPSSSEKSTVTSTANDLRRSFGTRNFVPPSSPFDLGSSSF